MASHSFTVTSPLDPAEAWSLLVDLERVPEWDAGIAASVRVNDGPILGSRFDVTATGFDGSPTSVIYEITEASEPDRFVMIGENEEFRATDVLTFEPLPDGCELTYDAALELLGDDPPLTDTQLASMFPKLVAVAATGLTDFLNPS